MTYDLKSTLKIRTSAGSGMRATGWGLQFRDLDRTVKPYGHGLISTDQGQGSARGFPQRPCGDGRPEARVVRATSIRDADFSRLSLYEIFDSYLLMA
jgi:hypothetical protein